MDNIEYGMPYGIQRPHIIISVDTKGWRNMVVEYFIIYPTNIVGFHLYQQIFFKNRILLARIKFRIFHPQAFYILLKSINNFSTQVNLIIN